MLSDIDLLPVYDSSQFNLITDLQVPLLKESNFYMRGVGFFTSGWIEMAIEGIIPFIGNGGKAYFITSPILDPKDREAIIEGKKAITDVKIYNILLSQCDDIMTSISSKKRQLLSWLIADKVLTFKFALPRNNDIDSLYHDKVGIFSDAAKNIVAIHGSINDSAKACFNGEGLSVFKSSDLGQKPYVEMHSRRLQSLWDNENSQFYVSNFPPELTDQMSSECKETQRPYSFPKDVNIIPTLRDYQNEAIKAWWDQGGCGIFEMATGTGKTFTALGAFQFAFLKKKRLAAVIIVPFLHLMEQWGESCRKFGLSPVFCSSTNENWQIELQKQIFNFKNKFTNQLCIISVHKTASSEKFIRHINKIPSENAIFIGDEVHNLGATHLCRALENTIQFRLGLSATPHRWYDETGTERIRHYFGDICFEYPISKAIEEKQLVPYDYYPTFVTLTDEEKSEYNVITEKISHYSGKDLKVEDKEKLKFLLLKRARILGSAENKLPELLKLLQKAIHDNKDGIKGIRGILIYSAIGKIKEIVKPVASLGLRCACFDSTIPLNKREILLKEFTSGEIQVLIAMKCLDEGVDVPATQTAYILASSTNPKEFVQRRGRVLRPSENKKDASIFDFIIFPEHDFFSENDKSLVKREMPRFAEFTADARNKFEARSTISSTLIKNGLGLLMDLKPWDIYKKIKEEESLNVEFE